MDVLSWKTIGFFVAIRFFGDKSESHGTSALSQCSKHTARQWCGTEILVVSPPKFNMPNVHLLSVMSELATNAAAVESPAQDLPLTREVHHDAFVQ